MDKEKTEKEKDHYDMMFKDGVASCEHADLMRIQTEYNIYVCRVCNSRFHAINIQKD